RMQPRNSLTPWPQPRAKRFRGAAMAPPLAPCLSLQPGEPRTLPPACPPLWRRGGGKAGTAPCFDHISGTGHDADTSRDRTGPHPDQPRTEGSAAEPAAEAGAGSEFRAHPRLRLWLHRLYRLPVLPRLEAPARLLHLGRLRQLCAALQASELDRLAKEPGHIFGALHHHLHRVGPGAGHIRSEERRVGKEGRSRWWPEKLEDETADALGDADQHDGAAR